MFRAAISPLPDGLRILLRLFMLVLPWSVETPCGDSGWMLDLPSEPLLALISVWMLATAIRHGAAVMNRLGQSRGWVLPLVWVGWHVWAAAFSELPLVSAKYVVVLTAHWWVFFVGALIWPDEWRRLLGWFLPSLGVAVSYAMIRHGVFFDWRSDQANLAPMPFFSDHNLLAAVSVSAFWPAAGLFARKRKMWMICSVLFAVYALVSSSRGGGLSFLISGMILGAGWWWVNGGLFQKAALSLIVTMVLLSVAAAWPKIQLRLDGDVSWRERENRYDCAWAMAKTKPAFGFGPGTFPMLYIPFQRPDRMTRISVTAPLTKRTDQYYGRGGGAHSEYMRALAETGWPGLALWLALCWGALRAGFGALRDKTWERVFVACGLYAYFIHGLVNDFQHDARMALLLWYSFSLVFGAKKFMEHTSDDT